MGTKIPSVWDVRRRGIPIICLSDNDGYFPTPDGYRRFAVVELLTAFKQKPTGMKKVVEVTTESEFDMCYIGEINGGFRRLEYFLLSGEAEQQAA